MDSRPEPGKGDARSNGSGVQLELEAGEELPGVWNDSVLQDDLVAKGIAPEEAIPSLAEEDTSQQNSESGSVESSQALRTQGANLQLLQDSASADETSSVPDDTPSIQVLLVPTFYELLLTSAGVRSLLNSK